MQTRVDEIAARIYRLSSFVPEVGGSSGFTFNQFLIDAEEPLLYHCGQRALFPAVAQAAASIIDLRRLRWIAFSHVEADECGSVEQWLAAAPQAQVVHGRLGCSLWLNDTLSRAPRALGDGEILDLGGRHVRHLDTPHVPHDLMACLLFEEATATLFCSDLFAHGGDPPPLTEGDILTPALAAFARFPFTPVTPSTAPTLRRLAALAPRQLAVMHGASFAGDGAAPLRGLADFFAASIAESNAKL